MSREWTGPTYYGQPALKNPHWDWKVSGYIWVAGVAGSSQALATLAAWRAPDDYDGALRGARILALLGSVAGAALLIVDLKTPQRFHHMLRILRPTSPMSFGTYLFSLFGAASTLSLLAEPRVALRWPKLGRLGSLGQTMAALCGVGISTYTASLMSATSNPHWAAAPRALGVKFATSAVASGAAALALWERLRGRDDTARQFEQVATIATLSHLAASRSASRRRQNAGVAPERPPAARRRSRMSLLVAAALPLGAYALSSALGGASGRNRNAAIMGSCAVLVGGMLLRHDELETGKDLARQPEAAFALAQPVPQSQRRLRRR
jgi:protein NrfD